MAAKIFLDANVLLEYVLKREHFEEVEEIMEMIVSKKTNAFMTTSVLQITGYWVAKAYGSTKAKKLLLSLLSDVTVIDIPHEISLIALNSKIDDIEDALQYYAAIHHKLNYFISLDKKLKKDGLTTLPVLTPNEFMSVL